MFSCGRSCQCLWFSLFLILGRSHLFTFYFSSPPLPGLSRSRWVFQGPSSPQLCPAASTPAKIPAMPLHYVARGPNVQLYRRLRGGLGCLVPARWSLTLCGGARGSGGDGGCAGAPRGHGHPGWDQQHLQPRGRCLWHQTGFFPPSLKGRHQSRTWEPGCSSTSPAPGLTACE